MRTKKRKTAGDKIKIMCKTAKAGILTGLYSLMVAVLASAAPVPVAGQDSHSAVNPPFYAKLDEDGKDALKVKHILRTIEMHPSRPGSKNFTAEVTEKELNAYIAYCLAQEKNPFINSLKVDLLDNNHIWGKIKFNAEQLNLDLFLGENLDFDFKGILYTRNGAARIDLADLQLYGQPVDPQLLDSIVKTVALSYGTQSGGIGDWYEMPKGVKRIIIHKGKAVLYY
jgi:hypothetical protein